MELDQLNGPESLRKVEKFLILLRQESGADRVSGAESHKLKYKLFQIDLAPRNIFILNIVV